MPATSRRAPGRPTRPTPGRGRLDVRVLRNLSNRLAYHWQLFTPHGLSRTLRSMAAAHRRRASARLPQPAGGGGGPHPGSGASALRRLSSRHRAAHRAPVPRQADLRRDGGPRVSRGSRPGAGGQRCRTAATLGARCRRRPHYASCQTRSTDASSTRRRTAARFRRRHGLGDAPMVLLLAKLTPRKGADVALRAFEKVGAPGCAVRHRRQRHGIRARRRDVLKRNARAMHVGLLEGRDRLDALAAADVVVYPSQPRSLRPRAARSPALRVAGHRLQRQRRRRDHRHGRRRTHRSRRRRRLAGRRDRVDARVERRLESTGRAWPAAKVRQLFDADVVCERLDALYREVIDCSVAEGRRSA